MKSIRTLLVSVLALAAPTCAVLTPEQIVSDLNTLTTKSTLLQTIVLSINYISASLVLNGQGPYPQVVTGFADIVTTATRIHAQLQDTPPIPAGAGSDAISKSFSEFSHIHQSLLDALNRQVTSLNDVTIIGAPIAAILRADQDSLDTFSRDLVVKVASHATDLQTEANALFKAIGTVANALSSPINTTNNARDGVKRPKRNIFNPLGRSRRGQALME